MPPDKFQSQRQFLLLLNMILQLPVNASIGILIHNSDNIGHKRKKQTHHNPFCACSLSRPEVNRRQDIDNVASASRFGLDQNGPLD